MTTAPFVSNLSFETLRHLAVQKIGSVNERADGRYGPIVDMCRKTSMFTFSGKRSSAIQPARWLPGSNRGK